VEIHGLAHVDASGWVAMSPLSAEQVLQSLAAARADYEPALHNFRLSESQAGVVRETVELAQKERMQVALVIMPEGPAQLLTPNFAPSLEKPMG